MDKSLNEVREKSTTSETVDQHPPPPHSHGQSLWADTPPARVRPGPLCLYLRARRQFTPVHRQLLCSLRSTVLPFAPFALVQVSSVSDQWQERDEWEASWLRDWQPTPHWLSSQRGDRHDQSFLWTTRVLTLDAYTQHPLQQHTQEASTQHAPLDHTRRKHAILRAACKAAGWRAQSGATPFTVFSERLGIAGRSAATDFSDACRCSSLCTLQCTWCNTALGLTG